MRSKRTEALGITSETRDKVLVRDGWKCVLCGERYGLQAAHFLSRGAGGLGIAENLIMLCVRCHRDYDQSSKRAEIKEKLRAYLQRKYANWDEQKLRYKRNTK